VIECTKACIDICIGYLVLFALAILHPEIERYPAVVELNALAAVMLGTERAEPSAVY